MMIKVLIHVPKETYQQFGSSVHKLIISLTVLSFRMRLLNVASPYSFAYSFNSMFDISHFTFIMNFLFLSVCINNITWFFSKWLIQIQIHDIKVELDLFTPFKEVESIKIGTNENCECKTTSAISGTNFKLIRLWVTYKHAKTIQSTS